MTLLLGRVLCIAVAPAAKVNTDTIEVTWNQFACGWYVDECDARRRDWTETGLGPCSEQHAACAAEYLHTVYNKSQVSQVMYKVAFHTILMKLDSVSEGLW